MLAVLDDDVTARENGFDVVLQPEKSPKRI
jgi:hypothetical protein